MMFASISKTYDLLNHLLSLNLDRNWRKFAASISGVKQNSKILDVCTGTGDLAAAYEEFVGEDGKVVATDFCYEMLILGQKKLRNSDGARGVDFIEADTLRLPFLSETFDIVAVAFGIRNVENLCQAIKEMTRVAKLGGRIVILEFSEPRNFLFRSIYQFYFTRILPLIGKLISRSKIDAYSYLPASVVSFTNEFKLDTILRQCDLSKVMVYPRTFGVVTIHVGVKEPYSRV